MRKMLTSISGWPCASSTSDEDDEERDAGRDAQPIVPVLLQPQMPDCWKPEGC